MSTPAMEEDTDNIEDQDMVENGTADHTPEDEDGQPERKRTKVEAAEDLEDSLDSEPEDLAKELTCPLCKSHFKDPVIISCSHNFCRSCIEEAWSGQESFVCPDCETVMTEKMYIANRALDNLVKKSISTATVNSPMTPMPKETTMIHSNCAEHDERLKLFCKEDGALSCLICRDSLKHSGHNFLPIMDAVEMYRTQLLAVTAPLQEALKATRKMNSKQREKIQQVKTNMEECEQHVVKEFKKLEDFVQQQEEMLLKQLQEQGKDVVTQMENNLTKVQENEKNLEQAISLANEKMSVTKAISFLTGTKSIIDKCQEQQALSSSNNLVDKQLNESTYKGPILSSVWKKMKSLISSDTEFGDQDNLAAQAPEKPATGPKANQQTKPVPPGTAPKTGAQANQQTKPVTTGTAPKTGAQANQYSKPATFGTAPKTGPQFNQQTKPFYPGSAPRTGTQTYVQRPQNVPAAMSNTEPAKCVWILGNALLVEAEQLASRMHYGLNLGLQEKNITVHWTCSVDMMWHHLLPKLKSLELHMRPPAAIVIHLGEDELGWRGRDALINTAQSTLRAISSQYSDTVVMWSWMLTRWEWAFTKMKKVCMQCNRGITQAAAAGRYDVIPHSQVESKIAHRRKRVNQQAMGSDAEVTDAELDIINMDFKAAILRALM
ncbi:nuclear factor 7, brain-like isoform X2 [Hyperolius riggenbachi]|uniref:nuclear factor 7, brain-like isoform X2 n=1 Tax=Hyperolius riggenbachi TaxID=752182 RepID=UPI0035A2CC70